MIRRARRLALGLAGYYQESIIHAMSATDVWTITTDGAARGNPGPAAIAYIIERAGQKDIQYKECLGEATNNVAEYQALIRALEKARELGGKRLAIQSDSDLMVQQMKGQYKVKHPGLLALHEKSRQLCKAFESVSFRHIRREETAAPTACAIRPWTAKRNQPPRSGPKPPRPSWIRCTRKPFSACGRWPAPGPRETRMSQSRKMCGISYGAFWKRLAWSGKAYYFIPTRHGMKLHPALDP